MKKNFDALKMFMLNLNERFKKTKHQLQNYLKLQKFRKFKTKICILKRKDNEIVEEATKKIELKKIEFFLNDLMQLISISKKIV